MAPFLSEWTQLEWHTCIGIFFLLERRLVNVLWNFFNVFFRMDWISGTPDGSTEESIDRIAMLRSTLGQFIPPVCECLGLFPSKWHLPHFRYLVLAARKLTGETWRDFKPSMLLVLVLTRRLSFTLLVFQPAYIVFRESVRVFARLTDRWYSGVLKYRLFSEHGIIVEETNLMKLSSNLEPWISLISLTPASIAWFRNISLLLQRLKNTLLCD